MSKGKKGGKGLLGRMFGKGRGGKEDEAREEEQALRAGEAAGIAGGEKDSAPETAPAQDEENSGGGWFSRLRKGLAKSSSRLGRNIAGIFTRKKLDEEALQELEDILIEADLGIEAATRITGKLGHERLDRDITPEEVREFLAAEIEKTLEPVAIPFEPDEGKKPFIILMVGVNGAGKTTTIGKMARKFAAEGKKVMLAAGDTFRAAAVEQLVLWGERTGAPVVTGKQGSDAAALAFDAISQAREQNIDILMMDTAGRLQNKAHLMDELKKIVRVMKKLDDSAPHAVLLVLDATTGQNAVSQAEVFGREVDVSGIVMTKLDGSARGGILVAIAERFSLPVHFIGVGEGVEDLQPFEAGDFARAIALQ